MGDVWGGGEGRRGRGAKRASGLVATSKRWRRGTLEEENRGGTQALSSAQLSSTPLSPGGRSAQLRPFWFSPRRRPRHAQPSRPSGDLGAVGGCFCLSAAFVALRQALRGLSSGSKRALLWVYSGSTPALLWLSSGSPLAVLWPCSGSALALASAPAPAFLPLPPLSLSARRPPARPPTRFCRGVAGSRAREH